MAVANRTTLEGSGVVAVPKLTSKTVFVPAGACKPVLPGGDATHREKQMPRRSEYSTHTAYFAGPFVVD
jgi:hypothetical protein